MKNLKTMINHNKSSKIDRKASLHDKALKSCSTSLPGGDLVDGLPPAASTKYSCLETPGRTELFVIFGRFFEKSWIFHAETYIFGILYVSNILMLKRMQEGLLLYRLLDRV